jgi:hypothetical protein
MKAPLILTASLDEKAQLFFDEKEENTFRLRKTLYQLILPCFITCRMKNLP